MWRWAWKSLLAHRIRTAVLGVGFGLGVSVMATLLGVGEVVLQQARAPELSGGGDLLVTRFSGPVTSGRYALSRITAEPGVVVMLLVATVAGLVPLLLAARWSARAAGTNPIPAPAATAPGPLAQEANR